MSEVITTDSIKKYLKENVETLLSSGVQSNSTNVSIISKSHLKNAAEMTTSAEKAVAANLAAGKDVKTTDVYNALMAVLNTLSTIRSYRATSYYNNHGSQQVRGTSSGTAIFNNSIPTSINEYSPQNNNVNISQGGKYDTGNPKYSAGVKNVLSQGAEVSAEKLVDFFKSTAKEWKTYRDSQPLTYGLYACHSNCHGNCHDSSRGRR